MRDPRNDPDTSFDDWMKAVDHRVQAVIGLSIHDLEDHPFRDWYHDEMSPEEAAHTAIEYAGGGDLL